MLKKLIATVAATAALALAPSAQAILIDSVGDTGSFTFTSTQGTNVLSADVDYSVTSYSTTQIILSMTVVNTSTLTTFSNAGLASIGFTTTPTLSGVSISPIGGVFDGATVTNIPSLNELNLCVWSGNNCNGGPQGDLLAVGFSDTFTLTLTGDFASGLVITDSGVKFQTSGGSFEFLGCDNTTGPCTPPLETPEPATLLLFGIGALGLAYRRRRAA